MDTCSGAAVREGAAPPGGVSQYSLGHVPQPVATPSLNARRHGAVSLGDQIADDRKFVVEHKPDYVVGQGPGQKRPALPKQDQSTSPGQKPAMKPSGAASRSPSPRQGHHSVHALGFVNGHSYLEKRAQQPAGADKEQSRVKEVRVKEEQQESGYQQEGQQLGQLQASWQRQGYMEHPGIAFAQHTQQASQFVNSHSNSNGAVPPQPSGASQRSQFPPSHLPPQFPQGLVPVPQPASHAEHVKPEPTAAPSAAAEAQLFFTQHPSVCESAPAPRASSQQARAAGHNHTWEGLAPQEYQEKQPHQLQPQQQQQQQRWQKFQQQQRWQKFQQQQRSQAFLQPAFMQSQIGPQMGPWIPHLQAHLPPPHPQAATPTLHTAHPGSQMQQQQQSVRASGPMHGWSYPMQSGAQHAQHGAYGIAYPQHSMPQQAGFRQAQQAQRAGANPSVQSMQGGQIRQGSGSSTAFIVWVDGELKRRGQTEKRTALRQFIQASRVSQNQMCQPMLLLEVSFFHKPCHQCESQQ